MAKRTWIKIKRGILEPKHRRKLGGAWFLYFYMLDQTNWEDGIIHDWRDEDASEELEIPLTTLRNHRRKLENELYIKTTQKQHNLEVAITNWTNPREYTGQKYNEIQGDNKQLPSNLQGAQNLTPSIVQGDNQGDNQGSQILTPVHRTHIITYTHKEQDTDGSDPESLLENFISITGAEYVPSSIRERAEWIECLQKMRRSGVTDEMMRQAVEIRSITQPIQMLATCSKMIREEA